MITAQIMKKATICGFCRKLFRSGGIYRISADRPIGVTGVCPKEQMVNKAVLLFCILVSVVLFMFCFYSIKPRTVPLKEMSRSISSKPLTKFNLHSKNLSRAHELKCSNICNASNKTLPKSRIVKFGHNKKAVFVANVCIENRKRFNKSSSNVKDNERVDDETEKTIIIYNSTHNFTAKSPFLPCRFHH